MGKMFVTAVGPHSFNGRLLLALRVSNEDTPLQEKLEVLAGHILPSLSFFLPPSLSLARKFFDFY